MVGDAGVLNQGGLPPPSPEGLGSPGVQGMSPTGLQQQSQRRDCRFPGGGAESPPRTPPHGSRSGTPRFLGTSGNHFLGRRGRGDALLAFTPPLSTPGSGALSPHLAVQLPQPPYAPGARTRLSGCAGSRYAGAQRWRGSLRSSQSYLEKESKGRIAHAQVGSGTIGFDPQ